MKDFNKRCYEFLRKVPKGKVTTYKEIAFALNTKAYRAVGSAMRKNQHTPTIPCHRVIKSDGNVGMYSGGIKKKIELLEKEGVKIVEGKIDLSKYIFKF
ncbi:MAG: MGMT family protein [Nanoarchaeota archaeon]